MIGSHLIQTLTLTLVFAIVLNVQVFAQQQKTNGQTDFFEMSLKELMEVPITTGASRPLTKEKMPATVTVITADEIKLLGLRHLTDVINYIVPGSVADIHRRDRSGLYVFRGIGVDNNGKYIFMVDGVDCTSLISWGAFNERYLGLMDELDRIEITQGVGSTLYGSGAISGVINFITKTGKDFQGTEITTGYGSWEKYEDTIKYGRKTSETSNEFYYFGFKRSHGSTPRGGTGHPELSYEPITTAQFGNDLRSRASQEISASGREWDHYAPSFKFHANVNRGDFTLRARYVRDKFEEPYVASVDDYKNYADAFWFHNWFFVQPEFKHKFNDDHSVKANLAVIMEEMGREKISDWYRSAGGSLVLKAGKASDTRGERKIRAQFFHYYDGWENHRLTGGLEYFWGSFGPDLRGRNKNVTTSGVQKYISEADIYYTAVFVEDIWQLDERTAFFAGVRVEDHRLTPISITPSAALTHQLDPRTDVKLIYNSGYHTPPWGYYANNESERESGSKPNALPPDPEKVQSFEAHLLNKWTARFDTALVAYYTIYKGLITYESQQSAGVPGRAYTGFPEVKSAGLELAGNYQTKNLKLKFSHSYSRPAHLSSGNFNRIFLSYNQRDWAQFPTHLSKAQAIINLIDDKCTLGLTYYRPWGIRGQRVAYHKLKSPADYLNATLTLKVKQNLELQASLYNITGEDHPGWGAYTYDGVSRAVNPHTEYFVRLIWRF